MALNSGRTLRSAWEALKPGGSSIDDEYRRLGQEEQLQSLSRRNEESRLAAARDRSANTRAYAAGVSNPRQADRAEGYTEANFGTLTTKYPDRAPRTQMDSGYTVPYDGSHLANAAGIAQQMVQSGDAIEAKFRQQAADLRKQYQFAETERERKMIRRQLAHVEAQRNAGRKIINNVYGEQIAQAEKSAGRMRGTAKSEGKAMGRLYEDAAAASRADTAGISESFDNTGLGVSAGGVGPIDALDTAGVIAGLAPIEQQYTRQMGNIGAQDVDFLAGLMGAEQGAQQGELQRVAMQMALQAQMQHDAAVNQRINQERMAYADQSNNLVTQGIGMGQDARMAGWGAGIDVAGQQSAAVNDRARWLQERQWQTQDRRAEQEWQDRVMQQERDWALQDSGAGKSFIPPSGEEQVVMFGALIADGNIAGAQALMNSSKVTPWARKQMRDQWAAQEG